MELILLSLKWDYLHKQINGFHASTLWGKYISLFKEEMIPSIFQVFPTPNLVNFRV